MEFERQRARVFAIANSYPVHIGCYGEYDPRTRECMKCQRDVSTAEIAFPNPVWAARAYADDIYELLNRIDVLEERIAEYEDQGRTRKGEGR